MRLQLFAVAALALLISPAFSQGAATKMSDNNQTAYVYKNIGETPLRLFVEKPLGWAATDKRPALVFFHGGAWKGGSVQQFAPHSRYFAARGLVGIQVQYRTLGDQPGPPLVCVQDAKSAMRWVRSHAAEMGIDPDRIAAGGGSAGGHLAAFTSMVEGLDDPTDDLKVSPRAAALLLFNPVYDNGPGGFGFAIIGDRYCEFSPIHNISADDPPSIVFLGTVDPLIPVETARKFKTEMENVGVRSDLHLYEGATHGFFNNPPYLEQTIAETENFLRSLGWLEAKLPA